MSNSDKLVALIVFTIFCTVFSVFCFVKGIPRMLREDNYEYVKADLVSCKAYEDKSKDIRRTRYSARWVYIINGQIADHYTTSRTPNPGKTRTFYVNRENAEDVSYPNAGVVMVVLAAASCVMAIYLGRKLWRELKYR